MNIKNMHYILYVFFMLGAMYSLTTKDIYGLVAGIGFAIHSQIQYNKLELLEKLNTKEKKKCR